MDFLQSTAQKITQIVAQKMVTGAQNLVERVEGVSIPTGDARERNAHLHPQIQLKLPVEMTKEQEEMLSLMVATIRDAVQSMKEVRIRVVLPVPSILIITRSARSSMSSPF